MASVVFITASIILPLFAGLFVRSAIGLWGHSGMGKPPMFGDFEAQRHWMEITISLPVGDWYRNTTENDLQYWGLDYPPLTAYVSYGFGIIANYFVPSLVELKSSHGHESYLGKTFMRASVLISDAVVFLPSLIIWILYFTNLYRKLLPGKNYSLKNYDNIIIYSTILLPSILLIDHGHFQYNGFCIGLALLGAICIHHDWNILGSILFCMSLNFKQMSLYYSPVFFFILLRKCLLKSYPQNFLKLLSIGVTVILSFGLLWTPFCIWHDVNETCVSSLIHVLSRQFPFSRGLFEDKVANLWYASSVVVNLKQLLSVPTLVRLSLAATLVLLSPIAYDMLRRPMSARRFLLCLNNSALAFFLASYQVHEKSLLLALVPMSLLVAEDTNFVLWFQILGTFTMFPLLLRDGLVVPYFVTIILYLAVSNILYEFESKKEMRKTTSTSAITNVKRLYIAVSASGMVILHCLYGTVTPPTKLPDLFPALFAIYGALNLLVAYLYCVIWQFYMS